MSLRTSATSSSASCLAARKSSWNRTMAKTRRKQRGGVWIWDGVKYICEAAGCPLRETIEQRKKESEIKVKLLEWRSRYYVKTGSWPTPEEDAMAPSNGYKIPRKSLPVPPPPPSPPPSPPPPEPEPPKLNNRSSYGKIRHPDPFLLKKRAEGSLLYHMPRGALKPYAADPNIYPLKEEEGYGGKRRFSRKSNGRPRKTAKSTTRSKRRRS